MLDLFMGLTLAGIVSGFLGWAGLLGSANALGKEGFFVLLAAAVATALAALVRALGEWLHAHRAHATRRAQRHWIP